MLEGRLKSYFQTTFLYMRHTKMRSNGILIPSGKMPLLPLSVDLPAVDGKDVGTEPPFVYRLIIDIGVRFG